jgi:hypothetical protein
MMNTKTVTFFVGVSIVIAALFLAWAVQDAGAHHYGVAVWHLAISIINIVCAVHDIIRLKRNAALEQKLSSLRE